MTAKPDITRASWRLEGTTIVVDIPMQWKRRGGRKVIIAPDGGDAWAPAKPRHDETLIRALARAHRWKGMLEDGKYRSISALAEAEKINKGFVSRLLNLTLLAPEIVEAVLNGRQPKHLHLEAIARGIPTVWVEQGQLLGIRTLAAAS